MLPPRPPDAAWLHTTPLDPRRGGTDRPIQRALAPTAVPALLALLVVLGACGSGVRRVAVSEARPEQAGLADQRLPAPARRPAVEGQEAAAPAPSPAPAPGDRSATRAARVAQQRAPADRRAARRAADEPVELPRAPTPSTERAAGPFGYEELRDARFGGILHGVGPMWNPAEMTGYRAAFPDTPPALQRLGINLAPSPRNSFSQRLGEFEGWLARFPRAIPCVTLKFDQSTGNDTGRGLERQLVSGGFDGELAGLAGVLAKLDRPSFLRIGPEVNGAWNGYDPALYPEAFRRVVQRFREHGATRTVFVWNVKLLADQDRPVTDWDPGDAWTDWWSLDLFSEDFRNPVVRERVEAFLAEAARRGKPVMIPESCPSGLDLDDPRTWRDWFAPYFALINGHPGVKAFLYSNRDFARGDVTLEHWGDMRIDTSTLAGAWRTELSGPQYVHETHLAQH